MFKKSTPIKAQKKNPQSFHRFLTVLSDEQQESLKAGGPVPPPPPPPPGGGGSNNCIGSTSSNFSEGRESGTI